MSEIYQEMKGELIQLMGWNTRFPRTDLGDRPHLTILYKCRYQQHQVQQKSVGWVEHTENRGCCESVEDKMMIMINYKTLAGHGSENTDAAGYAIVRITD